MVRIAVSFMALASSWSVCAQTMPTPCALTSVQRAPTDAEGLALMQPAPPNMVNCVTGVPLTVDDGATIWRCAIEHPDGEEESYISEWTDAVLLVRDGEWTRAWRDSVMGGRHDAFHVLTADLDADGVPEHILATWNAQGNGLGIHHWTVQVFDRDWGLIGHYQDVQDWGPSSVVRAPPDRKGCDLALSRYAEVEDTGVTELQIRFARMVAGQMVRASDRSPLHKRLSAAFERMRADHYERGGYSVEGDVTGWLRR
jgi:hypothetical protein